MITIDNNEKNPSYILWEEMVQHAEKRCEVTLEKEIESYLISMLMRHIDRPELVKQIFAIAFLEALQSQKYCRQYSLQQVGDQCLIFAGLFPFAAEKRHVKLSYFVNLGQSAYGHISTKANDLFGCLAMHFVLLMDVLQSIRPSSDLLPLQAYEQWNEVGSQRAYKLLCEYTQGLPKKTSP